MKIDVYSPVLHTRVIGSTTAASIEVVFGMSDGHAGMSLVKRQAARHFQGAERAAQEAVMIWWAWRLKTWNPKDHHHPSGGEDSGEFRAFWRSSLLTLLCSFSLSSP